MVARTKDVNIGQEAFILSKDGEIVRTMVAKLEENGYQFLNGDDEHRPHWFSFADAVSAVSNRISAKQTILRKQLCALARKQRMLRAQDYRDGVMSEPYRVVNLHDTMAYAFARSRCSRKLKNIRVPEAYLKPGHMVYVTIIPGTRSDFEVYRPHQYFVLETEVTSVCFSPDGQVHYTFSTPFIVEEFFLSCKEAVARLQNFLKSWKEDAVPFISSKQEKEEIAKLPDNLPF